MPEDLENPTSNPAPGRPLLPRRWPVIAATLGLLLVGGVVTSCWLRADRCLGPDDPPASGGGGSSSNSAAEYVDSRFRDWPAGKKPDVALVLSGQQHSYLKFCGCSER